MNIQRMNIFILVLSLGISNFVSAAEVKLGVIGDAGRTTASSTLVRDSMLRKNVLSTIMPGDNLYTGTYSKVWDPWKKLGFSFDVIAIGNHNSGYQNEINFFKMPGEYYGKVINGARFLVLNSDNVNNVKEQMQWVDNQLANAEEHLIFIVYHHPTYTISSEHTWDEKKQFQLGMRSLFAKYRAKITALLVGHDHLATLIHFDDIPVIVSGAVQSVRVDKPVDYYEGKVHVKTHWYFDSTPHWAQLSYEENSDVVKVEFIKAKNDRATYSGEIRTGYTIRDLN